MSVNRHPSNGPYVRTRDSKEEHEMKTTWRVTDVHATEGMTLAHLSRVEWFKRNPDFDAAVDAGLDDPPEEFIDAEPGEQDAEFVDLSGEKLALDIKDGLDLRPGDNVFVTVAVVEHVPA